MKTPRDETAATPSAGPDFDTGEGDGVDAALQRRASLATGAVLAAARASPVSRPLAGAASGGKVSPRQSGIAQLAREALAGNRSAHDALGDHFYGCGRFEQAAEHYSAALLDELYRVHPRLAGPRALLTMYDRRLIPPGSTPHAVAEQLARERRVAARRGAWLAVAAGLGGAAAAQAVVSLAGWQGLPGDATMVLAALVGLVCTAVVAVVRARSRGC